MGEPFRAGDSLRALLFALAPAKRTGPDRVVGLGLAFAPKLGEDAR
jgi:hypothetical protein